MSFPCQSGELVDCAKHKGWWLGIQVVIYDLHWQHFSEFAFISGAVEAE
jgi:hypothetical protein